MGIWQKIRSAILGPGVLDRDGRGLSDRGADEFHRCVYEALSTAEYRNRYLWAMPQILRDQLGGGAAVKSLPHREEQLLAAIRYRENGAEADRFAYFWLVKDSYMIDLCPEPPRQQLKTVPNVQEVIVDETPERLMRERNGDSPGTDVIRKMFDDALPVDSSGAGLSDEVIDLKLRQYRVALPPDYLEIMRLASVVNVEKGQDYATIIPIEELRLINYPRGPSFWLIADLPDSNGLAVRWGDQSGKVVMLEHSTGVEREYGPSVVEAMSDAVRKPMY